MLLMVVHSSLAAQCSPVCCLVREDKQTLITQLDITQVAGALADQQGCRQSERLMHRGMQTRVCSCKQLCSYMEDWMVDGEQYSNTL